ncbi:menaquinone biosynthesis family protein [Helicobacter sp. T3_23-1056]
MIQIAHSPDADDIFMYYAIKFGWVDTNVRYENIALDIESLNRATIDEIYDVSAISFGLYPLVRESYALLRTAVSFGNGYGPKLVRRKGENLKHNFKVALSGKYTTNALLFGIAYPQARVVYKNFLEIESAVLNGEVDAGVLIHESILDFSDRLEVECEIWDIWRELSSNIAKESFAKDLEVLWEQKDLSENECLPLPLGGMALRRSLPLNRAIEVESTLTKAVQIATNNKLLLSSMLLGRNLIRVNAEKLDTYLNLYANTESISLSKKQILALDVLFALGYKHGRYDKAIRAEEFFIPREYMDLRNS